MTNGGVRLQAHPSRREPPHAIACPCQTTPFALHAASPQKKCRELTLPRLVSSGDLARAMIAPDDHRAP